LQTITDYLAGLVCSAVSFLVMPTILLLLLRRVFPAAGEPIWRAYGQFLAWLIVAPVRLIRLLAREAFGRRR
jgi:hypothetical protein